MGIFTIAHFLAIGMFCATGLPRSVAVAEGTLASIKPPPVIDNLDHILDIFKKKVVKLTEIYGQRHINRQFQAESFDNDYYSKMSSCLSIMEHEIYALEDLIEAQKRRIESESRWRSNKNSSSPQQLAQLKFEYEKAIVSECKARINMYTRKIIVDAWEKSLEDSVIIFWFDGQLKENATKHRSLLDEWIAEGIKDVNDEQNKLNEAVAAAQQTRRDIELIKSGNIPAKYRGSSLQDQDEVQMTSEKYERNLDEVGNAPYEEFGNEVRGTSEKYEQNLDEEANDSAENARYEEFSNGVQETSEKYGQNLDQEVNDLAGNALYKAFSNEVQGTSEKYERNLDEVGNDLAENAPYEEFSNEVRGTSEKYEQNLDEEANDSAENARYEEFSNGVQGTSEKYEQNLDQEVNDFAENALYKAFSNEVQGTSEKYEQNLDQEANDLAENTPYKELSHEVQRSSENYEQNLNEETNDFAGDAQYEEFSDDTVEASEQIENQPDTEKNYYWYGVPGALAMLDKLSMLEALERTTKTFRSLDEGITSSPLKLTDEELIYFLQENEKELLSNFQHFCPSLHWLVPKDGSENDSEEIQLREYNEIL